MRGTSRAILNADQFNVRQMKARWLFLASFLSLFCGLELNEIQGAVSIAPQAMLYLVMGRLLGPGSVPLEEHDTFRRGLASAPVIGLVLFSVYLFLQGCVKMAQSKSMPNQSTDPTLSSGTPPAGQESRPR